MNYIKDLTIVKDGLSKELAAYHEGILELRSYLCSDKFHEDTTVQVADVLRRLDAAAIHALDVRSEHDNVAYAAANEENRRRAETPKRNCERCSYFGINCVDVDMRGHTEHICGKCYSSAKRNDECD